MTAPIIAGPNAARNSAKIFARQGLQVCKQFGK